MLLAEGNGNWCLAHQTRWRSYKCSREEFITHCATHGQGRWDFRDVPRPMAREFQYGLQTRHDSGRGLQPYTTIGSSLRFALTQPVESVLHLPRQEWVSRWRASGRARSQYSTSLAFLLWVWERASDAVEGQGWASEYDRDIWQWRRLGYTNPRRQFRFDGIEQPWLRELVKRWARWRLTTEQVAPTTVSGDLTALTKLSIFLAARHLERGPQDLTRPVLEDFVIWLRTGRGSAAEMSGHLSSLSVFFDRVRLHEHWAPSLPNSAVIYRSDYPRRTHRTAPRFVDEKVMRQVEDPANMARWPSAVGRLLTQLMIGTGLRGVDATGLFSDCVKTSAAGHPYLRYTNHKMKREAFVPISDELAQLLQARAALMRAKYPRTAVPRLFPRVSNNPDGLVPMPLPTYRDQLIRWLAEAGITDNGRPAHITSHQWRHTYATRLGNADVRAEVIQVLLDHSSLDMTMTYNTLFDQTVRAEWEAAQTRKPEHQRVPLDPPGPLADVVWANRARTALPNGACGLDRRQHCEVTAQPCLDCPVFITTGAQLPIHYDHRRRMFELIAAAERRGEQRKADEARATLAKLDRLISALEEPTDTPTQATEEATNAG